MWPSNYPQFVPNSPQSPKISFYIKYRRKHVALRSVIENKTRCQCQRKHTDEMLGLLRNAKGNDWVGCINCTKTQIKRTSLSSFRSSCSTSPHQKGTDFSCNKARCYMHVYVTSGSIILSHMRCWYCWRHPPKPVWKVMRSCSKFLQQSLNFLKLMCLSHAEDFPFRQNKIYRWRGRLSRHPNEFHLLPHVHNVFSFFFLFFLDSNHTHFLPSTFRCSFRGGKKKSFRGNIGCRSPRNTRKHNFLAFFHSNGERSSSTPAAFKDVVQREQKDAGLQGWNSK